MTKSKLREHEVLKEIKGYEGRYKINQFGDIYTIKNNFLIKRKTTISKSGYEQILLFMNGTCKSFLVHRLVAMSFIPNNNPDNLDQINHKDFNRLNNSASNLEWSNNYLNNKHRAQNMSLRTSDFVGVYLHKLSKRWNAQIGENGRNKFIGSFATEQEAINARESYNKNLIPYHV